MVSSPTQELELARRNFETRKSDWLLYRAFKPNIPHDTVVARFAVLRRAVEWTNWCQGYSAVVCLVDTWQAEDRWERMVRNHFDEEDEFSDDTLGFPKHRIRLYRLYFNGIYN